MARFARVLWNGKGQWVELTEDGGAKLLSGSPGRRRSAAGPTLGAEELRELFWLAPTEPSKVIGFSYNYKSLVGVKEHYEEPLFFLKSPTSICAHGSRIAYPPFASKVWVEVELAVVVGEECRNLGVEEVEACILGYTVASDITAENIHGRDWHLGRSKALDDFAPLGPFLVTDVKTDGLELRTFINDVEFQRGNTSDRIMNDRELVSRASHYVTLKPGDVILTGTPAGALGATVKGGDTIRHTIEGIGELAFSIV